ncbi:siderophore ABC transporter substrate-binding protein [Rhizobium lentis]|uniref:siderophore ABC transporter substrate-binding protein n=1 Tax=Rhizobium lentis TaxID=1138194 RepID=UPI001C83DE3D|nr:siderophore ABC transporter substrate-binding protein [Rhizobium lentis]MBX5041277.1 siderophore ABC transporter substrate-binding protein [Rhizobium lentis]MBX5071534.1 siderophore ABC transporter substrate-binding protein [Rhizobium lentis]MBX5108428.1 siderophore ABC transporter substrate-binding protein [Rhizobium lentis]MBX5117336.1 siderophore ABC transporter substrate-binding protein [Rhizobium lentis]
MSRAPYFAAMFMVFSFLAPLSSAHADGVMVQHAMGETEVKKEPKTVAVLDVSALDTLYAIGADVQGVPNDIFVPYLHKFDGQEYRKVGSVFEPDYEALNAMAPDLIIVGGRSSPKYGEVSKIAPTIDLTPDLKDRLGSTIKYAEELGEIFGKQKEVFERVTKLTQSVESVKEKARATGNGLLVMTTGGKMSAMGPGTWFGMLYDTFGITPAVKDLGTSFHGQIVSPEFVLETDPDWLFVIDRDAAIGQAGASAKQVVDNELIRQTKAWKLGHVVYLDPVNWYIVSDGLIAMQAMADELSKALSSGQ